MSARRRLLCAGSIVEHGITACGPARLALARGCCVPAVHKRWMATKEPDEAGPGDYDSAEQGEPDTWMDDRHVERYMDLPPEQQFPYLHWGFRDGGEVKAWCLPTVLQTRERMSKIPYSSVEAQLESRGLTVGEFKEGALLAYEQTAQIFSTPLAGSEEKSASSNDDGDGDDEPFAEEMFDQYLLKALRTQRDAYTNLGWQPRVNVRRVRATPISVVVAPANSLSTGDELRPDGTRPARWAVMLGRMMAVLGGLWRAMRGSEDHFCYLLDCHMEVEEDFELVDIKTGEVVLADKGSRDHLFTFMAKLDSPLDMEEELSWQLRDMNYFVSHGGLVDEATLRKLK